MVFWRKVVVMKKAILLLFWFISWESVQAQELNFEAVDVYFQLVEGLKKDLPLATDSWNEFISLTGIQLYVRNNGLDEKTLNAYKRNLEITYMPKNDSILKARLLNPEKYFVLWVFNNYKTQEKELKTYYEKIKKNKSTYLDSAYANSYRVLPTKMHTRAEEATIYFIPLMNDAVAEDKDIVLTLYCAYHYDKLKFGALAGHEMHHLLRTDKSKDYKNDAALYQAMRLLLNEGSADLIDKAYTASEACPDDLKYYEYFMQAAPEALAMLDTAIQEHVTGKKKITEEDIANIVPMSGHVPGCYMGQVIRRNGLETQLIAAINDPLKFMLLYNEAAARDAQKPYVFSELSMNYLRKKFKNKRA